MGMGLVWAQTAVLECENGDSITYRTKYTAADRDYISQRATKVRRAIVEGDDQPDLELSLNMSAMAIATAERMIEGWTFRFPEGHPMAGNPVPLTKEYIGRLDEDTIKALNEALTAANPVRTAAQSKS